MHTYILLDRSGSMGTNWVETLGAVNGYVDELKNSKDTSTTLVDVAAFDAQGGMRYTQLRRKVQAQAFNGLGEGEVSPSGMTPLYDAIGRVGSQILEDNPEKATLVIVTDGAENSSREYDNEASKALIEKLESKGYDVTFIGADFDNFAQSASLGGTMDNTVIMNAGHYGTAFKSMAKRTAHYASTGEVRGWTSEEREKAKGK